MGPDDWLKKIRSSIALTGCGGDVAPIDWDHTGAYILARHAGASPVGNAAAALGILILNAVGAPQSLINAELKRLAFWDGATRPHRLGQSDVFSEEWTAALALVPRKLLRNPNGVNRSRYGFVYIGPRWWEKAP